MNTKTLSNTFIKWSRNSAFALLLIGATAQVLADSPVPVPITNGDMESFTYGADLAYFAPYGYRSTNLTPTGWTSINPSGSAWQSMLSQPSPAGGNYFSMQYRDGWGADKANTVGISQTLNNLVIGATYQVNFYSMANHTQTTGMLQHWDVSLGGQSLSGADVSAANSGQWTASTLTFKATETSELLSFLAIFVGGVPGSSPSVLNLDGVNVMMTAVPEPTTMLLFGLGLGALMLYRRRTRQ